MAARKCTEYLSHHMFAALLCLSVHFFCPSLALAEERPIYFPANVWTVEEETSGSFDMGEFYEGWFGSQLYAMREPSLSQRSDEDAERHIRLLVLPTFTPALALRITRIAEGPATLTVTVLDGAGGYEPGQVSRQLDYTLTEADLASLNGTLESIGAWVYGSPPRHDQICTDGITTVFEMADISYYHAFSLHNCELLPSTERLIAEFFALTPEFENFCAGCRNPFFK